MPTEFYKVIKNVEYIIPIKGLALGEHRYTFKIDNAFFSKYEYFNTNKGLLNLTVDMVKESNLMDFKFHFVGYIELVCDRCLDKFNLNIEKKSFRLIVNYGNKFEEISDEIVTIPSNDASIDLGKYIYEFISLMLPIKKVHVDDENGNSACNKEMLDKISSYTEYRSDPRWDALKNIKID